MIGAQIDLENINYLVDKIVKLLNTFIFWSAANLCTALSALPGNPKFWGISC